MNVIKVPTALTVNTTAVIVLGSDAVFDIKLNETINTTVVVRINGTEYNVAIVNGAGNLTVAHLKEGIYYINATFAGDEKYVASVSNTVRLNVTLMKAYINVTATDAVYHNASEITVLVPKAQEGFVRITVPGADINVTVEIINGTAKFNASGLDVAKYDVFVTYLGADKYAIATNETSFSITKADLDASVIAQNVTVKENTSFVIDVPDDFKGLVNITVATHTYIGSPDALIEMARLSVGKHTAHVTFYADGNYKVKELDVNFTVTRPDMAMNVTIDTL